MDRSSMRSSCGVFCATNFLPGKHVVFSFDVFFLWLFFIIIGFPDRVERVYVSSSNCSGINLGWDSVPAVPGHQVTYCVAVYNITRRPGEGQTTSLEMEVCVLRETIFVLTVVADASPLHVFEFTVTARTEVGPGPTSQTLQANFTFGNNVQYAELCECNCAYWFYGPQNELYKYSCRVTLARTTTHYTKHVAACIVIDKESVIKLLRCCKRSAI